MANAEVSALLEKKIREPNSDFILSIKTFPMPKFRGAYNPSVIEHNGGYLLLFRHDGFISPLWSHPRAFRHRIGAIFLNENFDPISQPRLILQDYFADPRAFKVGDQIYLCCGSPRDKEEKTCLESAKLNLSHLFFKHKKGLQSSRPIPLSVHSQNKFEKNWVPFVYEEEIYFLYSINPQRIVKANLTTGFCEDIYRKNYAIDWKYGPIRGGTPALLVDGHYLAFFHSSLLGREIDCYRYFIGAYQFSSVPPFELKKISEKPFIHHDFYSSPFGELTGSQVLFPGGFIIKEDKIILFYGENDVAIKIMTLDKEKLLNSLKDV